MDKIICHKIEQYLQNKFESGIIKVIPRSKQTDSAEVFIKDEFIGVIYVDDEDGDLSYSFNMAILEIDL
tara:strand:+ start:17723 stop:17929 length:207 start_codon:yes stop_codon:yes gene_type:complete